MTIFDLLINDHRSVNSILNQIAKTTVAHLFKREALFIRLQEEFTRHAISEEKVVYAPLKRKKKNEFKEDDEEHRLVESLFIQISRLCPSDSVWTTKMALLTKMIRSHVEEEETSLFKKLSTNLAFDELDQMSRDFEFLKKETAVPMDSRSSSLRTFFGS